MHNRIRWTLTSVAAGLALVVLSVPTLAQAALDIYKGQTTANSGLVLAPWGSGEAKESEEFVYTGARSIRITTHGLYQGVRLVLQNPVDLQPSLSDPAAYLQFVVRLPAADSGTSRNRYGPGGMRGGMPGMPGGGGRGAGGPGMGGYSGTGNVKILKPKPLSSLRVVLITDDSKQIETNLAVTGAHPETDDWHSVAIPVASIAGLKDTDAHIKEIRIFGDSPAVVYLGEARVIKDETPINVDDLGDQTVARNDIVTFVGSADAGPVSLVYQWTFIPTAEGTKADVSGNLPVDAEGRSVKHQFRKSGDYTVALTVRDRYGLKKPVTKTCNVHVTL